MNFIAPIEEISSEMANSLVVVIMHNDVNFRNVSWKWLGGVVDVRDKILGLSSRGYLYTCDKVSKKFSSREIIDILPPPLLGSFRVL